MSRKITTRVELTASEGEAIALCRAALDQGFNFKPRKRTRDGWPEWRPEDRKQAIRFLVRALIQETVHNIQKRPNARKPKREGFPWQMDFFLNYDIKYRMGQDEAGEETA